MSSRSRRSPLRPQLSLRATLILLGVLVAYVLLQPSLERWLGVELPSLVDDAGQRDEHADVPPRQDHRHAPATAQTEDQSAPGVLKEISRNVFESPAGLRYRPGGEEGHRLQHIMQHSHDDPSRPIHGVFDGEQADILAVIDETWRLVEAGGQAIVEQVHEDGREIYTVDLGRRIGYTGGESGARRHHPAAEHIRLVLDGRNVITAFPVNLDRRR